MINDQLVFLIIVLCSLFLFLNGGQLFAPFLPPSFENCLAGFSAVSFQKTMPSFAALVFGLISYAHSVEKIINLTFD